MLCWRLNAVSVLHGLCITGSALGESNLQAEYTYVAILVLLGVFVLLTVWRMLRAAGNTIGQLRYESQRDRYQHKRIADERDRTFSALERGPRRSNISASKIHWDDGDKRAHRLQEAAGEVYRDINTFPRQEMRTPWGWPSSGNRRGAAGPGQKTALRNRVSHSTKAFFRSRQVVDEAYRARQAQCIRALIEDRYGRVGHISPVSDIEWSTPSLPPELLRERAAQKLFARQPDQDPGYGKREAGSLKLVSGKADAAPVKRKVAGQ